MAIVYGIELSSVIGWQIKKNNRAHVKSRPLYRYKQKYVGNVTRLRSTRVTLAVLSGAFLHEPISH